MFWSCSELDCDQEEIRKKKRDPNTLDAHRLQWLARAACPLLLFSFSLYLIGYCLGTGHIHLTDILMSIISQKGGSELMPELRPKLFYTSFKSPSMTAKQNKRYI